ncbi:hypothetical protein B0J17DRAFT_681778 [Rhizoctonia solani]|nr:hypothetical protein B0J17DRAFT_681778 [Rhizoctonia solani]
MHPISRDLTQGKTSRSLVSPFHRTHGLLPQSLHVYLARHSDEPHQLQGAMDSLFQSLENLPFQK